MGMQTKHNSKLKKFYGTWKDMPKKDFEEIISGINRMRKSGDKNFKNRQKKAIE